MPRFSTTQIDIVGPIADKFRKAANSIDTKELMGHGIDYSNEPHVTVRWGLDVDDCPKELQPIVDKYFPFYIKMGKTKVFDPSESSDWAAVVVVEITSPILKKLNEAIGEAVPNEKSEHEYHAHATVAYVKPEYADKYKGHTMLEGVEYLARELTFSSRNKQKTTVKPK